MDVEQITQVIALSEIFIGLRESLLRRLAEVAVVQDVAANATIIRRDGTTARMGLLLTGKLAYSAHVDGLEVVALMLGPGSWIGLSALFEQRVSRTYIRTMTNGSMLWLDATDVLRLLVEAPEDAQVVLTRAREQLAARLDAINRGIEEAFK